MDSRTRDAVPLRPVTQAGCVGENTLQSHVLDLNTRLLQFLVRDSFNPPSWTSLWPQSLGAHLRRLTPDQCALLGNCPVLLMDLPWRAPTSTVRDGEIQFGARAESESQALWHSARVLAWHAARHCPATARVLLGWSVEQVRAVTSCSLWDLQSQCLDTPAALRLRWANRPAVWKQMLEAVLSGDMDRLQLLQVRCFQLIAADLEIAESRELMGGSSEEVIVVETVRPERPRLARRPEARAVVNPPRMMPRTAGTPRALPVNCPE